MVLIAGVLGALFALGVVTFVVAMRPVAPGEVRERPRPALDAHTRVEHLVLRLALGVSAAVVVGVVTRWPMAALLVGLAGFLAPSLLGGEAQRKTRLARVEAVAALA
jgi:tight adherence protein B